MPDKSTSENKGWFSRFKHGLSASSKSLSAGLGQIFDGSVLSGGKLSEEQCEMLEDQLIMADLGPEMSAHLASTLAKRTFKSSGEHDLLTLGLNELAKEIEHILQPVAKPLIVDETCSNASANPSENFFVSPFVILMVGVNGSGKTTTIGKLAQMWTHAGKRVTLAAGDTFRAAAAEQLAQWAKRCGAGFISRAAGSDPAALAFSATEQAKQEGVDILLIDTAGRLQNRSGLIDELKKIHRVIGKALPGAPHATLLTIDATTGQNAKEQVRIFRDAVNVSNVVVTKLDGSARGGIVVALAGEFGIPVSYVGLGEGADDLQPFDPSAFARGLVGLPPEHFAPEHFEK